MSVHGTAILNHPPMHRDYRDDLASWWSPQIDRNARIEAFVVVEYGIYRPTVVGCSWLMPYVHVGHDARVGNGCEIASRTVVGAHSTVEDGAKLGIGVIVKPGRTIGAGALVGHGAVVTKDVPAGETWISPIAASIMERATPSPPAVVAANDNLTEAELVGWDELAAAPDPPEEWAEEWRTVERRWWQRKT